jgi:pimeloyl-ACP methyl ester carboxylesterase
MFQRRNLLASTAVAALGALNSGCTSVDTARDRIHPKGSIVLVHGAWYGGWCWKKLTPLLVQAGHAVYAPTLTGLGDRAHQSRPDIDLDQHVRDLLAVLEVEDLNDVTLVGHSYGGFVIGAVALRARARLRQLIYLDAFVPDSGQRVVDYLLPLERREAIVKAGQVSGFVAPIPPRAHGVTDEQDIAWITPRLARQPFATFMQPMPSAPEAPPALPRSYIACAQSAAGAFGPFAARFRNDPAWRFRELATGHNAMIIVPQLLARTLTELA